MNFKKLITEEKYQAGALLLVAFILRAVYAWACDIPPWNDMAGWDQARLEILQGKPYTLYWTPLYPVLLAAFSLLSGGSYFALNLFNSLLTTAACLFTYLAARDIFGAKTGILALLLAALYVDSIWYSSLLLSENLAIMMVALLTWRFAKEGPSLTNGFLLGLTCLTKGLFLALTPGFIAWAWIRDPQGAWGKRSAAFSGILFLTLLPWSIRNTLVYKAPVLLEPHWASAMFAGHNPYATGGYDYTYLNYDYGKFELDPKLSIIEKNRIYLRKSLEFIHDNPLKEVKLTLLRASKHLTFATSFVAYREPYPVRKLMFGLSLLQHMLLFPLCVIGMVFSFRDRGAFGFSMIVAILAGAFITLFSANTRMRIPLVPAMLALAAHGALLLPGLAARLKQGDTADIKGRLAAAAAAIFFLFGNFIYQVASRYSDVAGRFN